MQRANLELMRQNEELRGRDQDIVSKELYEELKPKLDAGERKIKEQEGEIDKLNRKIQNLEQLNTIRNTILDNELFKKSQNDMGEDRAERLRGDNDRYSKLMQQRDELKKKFLRLQVDFQKSSNENQSLNYKIERLQKTLAI